MDEKVNKMNGQVEVGCSKVGEKTIDRSFIGDDRNHVSEFFFRWCVLGIFERGGKVN